MAYPLSWPSGIRPSSESWVPGYADRGGGPGITGTEQTVGSPLAPWRAKLTLRLFREDIVPFRGFLLALRGRAGTFTVGPRNLYGQPQPGVTDAALIELGLVPASQAGPPFDPSPNGTLAADAGLLDREVQITMPAMRRPVVGNYVGFGASLHVVTAVSGTDPTFTCSVEPGLRNNVSAGALAVFNQPVCLMRQFVPLDPGGLTVAGDTMMTDVTLDLVEAF